MKVTLKDYMGSDLTVVNCARISFNKIKEKFDDKDERLINYLATHGHWTPFSHPQISLHVKAPIFVLRQLLKHQVGLTWNEVSRRYVDYEPEFYYHGRWREKADNKKQGSSESVVSLPATDFRLYELFEEIKAQYKYLVSKNIAPEMARMILPLSTYSEGIWTGSLAAFARVYRLRNQPDAQKETQEIAKQIGEIIEPLFPVSWKALTNA